MALNTVTVTWAEKDPALSGVTGSISFTLSAPLFDATDGEEVEATVLTYPLAQGKSMPLVANDNASVSPSGSYYTISIHSDDGSSYSFEAFINFSNGATQKLASLVPLTSLPAMLASLPVPGGTAVAGDAPIATGTGEASAWTPVASLLAATPTAGFTLQNGTPSILTWTAPSDGKVHYISVFASLSVTSNETGGTVVVNATAPDGSNSNFTIFQGGLGVSFIANTNTVANFAVKAGSTVTIEQVSALTGGAAQVWVGLFGV